MMNQENPLLEYRKLEREVRGRAKQVKLEYTERVPQARWLRLDLDGAVLLTPAEFSYLPQSSREFFLDGNASSYRNDRVAMRGERTVLLDGGIFALSLGGPRTPSLDHTKLDSIIDSFRYNPQIVFSNADEFKYFTREKDIESSLFDCLPNARLVVVTLGQQGSIIRFEDRLIRIPAILVNNVMDERGAGDTYMGTMLGRLFNQPYKSWNFNLVKHAARVATFAASKVVQSTQSRLTTEMAQLTQEYARNLNLQ